MPQRTFNVNGKVYSGFDRNFNPVELDTVVIVSIDGELEVYGLDTPQNLSSFTDYISQTDRGVVKLLGVYQRK